MELGLTIPLQRLLKIKNLSYGKKNDHRFCWDAHTITLNGRASFLAVHCSSRYVFTLYDLRRSEWSELEKTFLDGLQGALRSIGISEKMTADYLQQAGALRLTKTHGRREVAYLNRAWEDVLAFDYMLDYSTREQLLLDHAVNTRLCRGAGDVGVDSSANRLREFLRNHEHLIRNNSLMGFGVEIPIHVAIIFNLNSTSADGFLKQYLSCIFFIGEQLINCFTIPLYSKKSSAALKIHKVKLP